MMVCDTGRMLTVPLNSSITVPVLDHHDYDSERIAFLGIMKHDRGYSIWNVTYEYIQNVQQLPQYNILRHL